MTVTEELPSRSFGAQLAMLLTGNGYRPVVRRLFAELDAAARLNIAVPIGKLRLRWTDARTPSLTASIRSRDVAGAKSVKLCVDAHDDVINVSFEGPFGSSTRTIVSVDVEMFVPQGTRVAARTSLGAVELEELSGECDASTGLGPVRGALSAIYKVERVHLESSLGNVDLTIPRDVPVSCHGTTSLGKLRIDVANEDGGVPVKLHTSLGDVRVKTSR